ncbi:hypothetical protein SAMN05444397_11730 [Flavobacterium aquidurense]|uniref:Lipocalin-like domain-containing protein n=1 Tax=Flavobacterium frigidimaris TaxID=262320 RepID=A0ABX4BJ62_FLAFR|nr:hypothetical protein [Flavobacterium frigidimaris]OXA75183.1 hypothetical protein B0A65_22485 [Flavobacterium frigidimaris]SDZ66725.1 hypothetical protein SAMN05444397_11730 [Flavobacterium aquidurense]
MKAKVYLLLILFSLVGCNMQNSIEENLITESDEHWVYYNSNSTHFTYFKFNKDKLSHRFKRNEKGQLYEYHDEGDVDKVPKKWSVSKDSVLTWGKFKYDVVSYSKSTIILTFPIAKEPFAGYIFLVKQKDSEIKTGPSVFEQKSLKHRER